MKHSVYLSVLLLLGATPHLSQSLQDFDVILEPKWDSLDRDIKKAEEFGGKWILAGSITFKKKSKEPVFIENIQLSWDGDTLENLIASLYKKNPDKDFLPIEDNLVCDGLWNKTKQALILNFESKETLGPTTIYYLVLTVPEHIEPVVKKGAFCLEKECLPGPFKKCLHKNKKLSLTLNTTQEQLSPKTTH